MDKEKLTTEFSQSFTLDLSLPGSRRSFQSQLRRHEIEGVRKKTKQLFFVLTGARFPVVANLLTLSLACACIAEGPVLPSSLNQSS